MRRPDRGGATRGFTLVELGIVLGIIAILVVALLVYIRQAQQASRDDERKSALSKIELALEQWAANHSGTYLDGANVVTASKLYSAGYLDQDVTDPLGGGEYVDASGNGLGSVGDIAIRDRLGGTSGSGYCVVIALESAFVSGSPSDLYRVTDINKSGGLAGTTAVDAACKA